MRKNKFRKGVFAVTYSRDSEGKIWYVLLKRKLHWKGWEFSKGKIEKSESKRQAARREVFEETGLKILRIRKFNVSGKYKYEKELPDRNGIIGQTFDLFAVEVERGKVKIDKLEHSDYKWTEFGEALKKLTWSNQRKCLKIVNDWLLK